MSNYTPILIPFGILFFFQSALAQEAKPETKQETSDCQPVPDEIEARQAAIQATVKKIVDNVKYLKSKAHLCMRKSSMERVDKELFRTAPALVKSYEKRVNERVDMLKLGLCKRQAYESTSACEGAKKSMQEMLAAKKKPIAEATENFAEISSAIAAYKKRTYTESIGFGYTPYTGMVAAFEQDSSHLNCPRLALATLNRTFHPKNNAAAVNKLWQQVSDLEKYLKKRDGLIDKEVAEVAAIKCETAVAEAPLKANLPDGRSTISGEVTEQIVAPIAASAVKAGDAGAVEFTEQLRSVEIPAQKLAEEPKELAVEVAKGGGSEGAVMAALQTEKEMRLNSVTAVDPALKAATEVVADKVTEVSAGAELVAKVAPTEVVATELPATEVVATEVEVAPLKAAEGVKSVVEVEKLDREKDFWGIPNYRNYDTYKESAGLTNVVRDVNVNDYYKTWLASRSIDANQPDFGLRLQKAINATAGNDGDSLGPSTYQDGIVGPRTKSSIYLIQTNVAYNALFEQNLRKQGLIP